MQQIEAEAMTTTSAIEGRMTRVGTMNVGKSLASKVLAVIAVMQAQGLDICCLQEIDVNVPSWPRVVAGFRARGFDIFAGAADAHSMRRCAIVSKLPGKLLQLEGVDEASRAVAMVLEVQRDCSYRKVIVGCTYGHASCPESASRHSGQVIADFCRRRADWVLLGDFNVALDEAHAASELAGRADVRSLDEAFLEYGPLPATSPSRLRRIDFGLASRQLSAEALYTFEGIADHRGTAYDMRFAGPRGFSGPSRSPLNAADVSPSRWDAVWRPFDASFKAALDTDVEEAWSILSSAAEEALAGPTFHSPGCARHSTWRPRCERDVHKAADGTESLLLTRMRRLQRRLAHMRRVPQDVQLRRNICGDLGHLGSSFPELLEFMHGGELGAVRLVDSLVAALEKDAQESAVAAWRQGVDFNFKAQCAWVKRRSSLEKEIEAAGGVDPLLPRVAIHPMRVIADAEAQWLPRWTRRRGRKQGAVESALSALPELPMSTIELSFTGAELFAIAKGMCGKAGGPDGWTADQWCHLPMDFWSCLASLWQSVVRLRELPRIWRYSRVALIPKANGDCRPLSLLCIAYRIGAKSVLSQVSSWAEGWLGHQTCGGVPRRSLKDVVSQLLVSNMDGGVTVAEDLSKFFDGIDHQDLDMALARLGAPRQFRELVGLFNDEHYKLFSAKGLLGGSWHKTSRGLCQGCPLSPLLASTVMLAWALRLEQLPGVRAVSFVDDRYLLLKPEADAGMACRFSRAFDSAMGFACDSAKCSVAAPSSCAWATGVARTFGYELTSVLKVLGLTVGFNVGGQAALAGFSAHKARQRLRLASVVAKTVEGRRLLFRSLVAPLWTWAGAFGGLSADEAMALRQDVICRVGSASAGDKARPLALEIIGYDCDPVFSRRWAALREVTRVATVTAAWQETAPLDVALRAWPTYLFFVRDILTELGWQVEENGRVITRVDAQGRLRRFCCGQDRLDVLREWVEDWHRRDALARCQRVHRDFHRTEPALARGGWLPPITNDTLCTFRGHCKRFAVCGAFGRQLCLGHGCSGWDKAKRNGLDAVPKCRCGLEEPSRPHLLWRCPEFTTLSSVCGPPTTRLAERLLAVAVPETPPAPPVLDAGELLEDLAADLRRRWTSGGSLLLGTDGSAFDQVAAASVAVEGGGTFASGLQGEDQSSYKAELDGLRLCLQGLWQAGVPGRAVIAVDCKAAIDAWKGHGCLVFYVSLFQSLKVQLRLLGIEVDVIWVPSHCKPTPVGWRGSEIVSLQRLRSINERADGAAGRLARRRATGSLRQRCLRAREEAARWEVRALTLAECVAEAWDACET
mmetsp:Transcript_42212/g.100601  ORF Transcript_42212/g.100601 Transcript_42212/m.100601 type:complete len:1314 (+) Transcript_42212:1316-5257(+)